MVKAIAVITALIAGAIATADPVQLDLLNPPCELTSLLDSLESRRPIKSEFVETRKNPFQKRPRRFNGVIYWHPDHGLCLAYTSPGNTRITVNTEVITVFRQDREVRQIAISPEDAGMDVFLKLFAWDTDWLMQNFEATADMDGEQWEIQLKPLANEPKSSLIRIELRGHADLLTSIKLDLTGGKDIAIALENQEIPWEPDPVTFNKLFGMGDVRD